MPAASSAADMSNRWLSLVSIFCAISTSGADVNSEQSKYIQSSANDKQYDVALYRSTSGFQVMRNTFLPNGVYIFGIVQPKHCVQSCVTPCTAADFDDIDFTCWHHYGHLGCSLVSALYRQGMTHYRNIFCDSSVETGHVLDSRGSASYSSVHPFGSASQHQRPAASFGSSIDGQLVCGRPVLPPYEARIFGGDEARPRSWPWQVALRNKNSRSSRCAGSLIAQQWVLTTAHCVDQDTDPSHWLVLTGAHDLLAVELERVAHSVDRIVIHKHFSLDTFDNDIALVRLSSPVEWSQAVSSVCLPPKDLELPGGTKCVITGWGVASRGKRPLKQAGIPLVSVETCRRTDWLGSEFTITDRMICAGFASGGVDTCQGDSGGPLMCYLESRWVQAGVTSFGRGCGLPQKPGIYTKVSKFIQWINNVVKRKPSYV